MNRIFISLVLVGVISCGEQEKTPTAQEIIDHSIEVSGGSNYADSNIDFDFRQIHYSSKSKDGNKVLERIITNDTAIILDRKEPTGFKRFVNDSLVVLADTTANKYSNSVNSVHYFANLPYGLNDRAVQKKLLGKVDIKGKSYYKIEITFKEEGGGDDFDDVYIYWFHTDTFKPDYLAYEFHVNGGGQRFREAFNERYVGDIRFVDYMNYKPKVDNTSIYSIDSLYVNDQLELLSNITLENVTVNRDSYN